MMKKSKEAKCRVDIRFNPQRQENRSLLEKLTSVSQRKFSSVSSIHDTKLKEGQHEEQLKRIEL
jgi:hypothetical protein